MTGWHVVEPIDEWVPWSEWTLLNFGSGEENLEAEWRPIGVLSKSDSGWGVTGVDGSCGIARSKSIGSGACASSSRISSGLNGLKLSWYDCVAVGDSSLGPFKTTGRCPAWVERMCCVLPDFDLHRFEQIGHSHQIVDSEYWRSGLRAGCGIEKPKPRVHVFGP